MFTTKFYKQPQNKKLFTVLQCFVVHLPDWIHIVDMLPMSSTNYEVNSEYFYISVFAVKNTEKWLSSVMISGIRISTDMRIVPDSVAMLE